MERQTSIKDDYKTFGTVEWDVIVESDLDETGKLQTKRHKIGFVFGVIAAVGLAFSAICQQLLQGKMCSEQLSGNFITS